MSDVVIEPSGGFIGGNSPTVSMKGRVPWTTLSIDDQARIDKLFADRKVVDANLRYRLTREGPNGPESVYAPSEAVPKALIDSIETNLK